MNESYDHETHVDIMELESDDFILTIKYDTDNELVRVRLIMTILLLSVYDNNVIFRGVTAMNIYRVFFNND
jgi:hypothetical protein